uniref:Uncharacterized protein n=1 Tax=Cajanus cajan TaxID=3821 RepID=A0A151RY96_CAJCA|nr:hypothetical protein KK1_030854 [Cajanus cajan]
MSSENHHHPHHYFYHQNLHIHHRTTFLPMLCSRPSIKDVSLPQWRDPPGSFSNDPLSPRIVNSANVPRNHKHKCSRNENVVPISIENMDPPLPVIKRVQKPEEEKQVDSLWKRRSGGAALKSLQLQQIHHSRHHPQITSV